MGLFGRKKDATGEDTRIASIIEASGNAIVNVQTAGRYPLSLLVIGAAVVIVSLIVWKFVDAVGDSLPWLLGFAAFLAVLGVVVYALDSQNRQRFIQQSLDHYHDLVRDAFRRYLESFDKLDGYQLQGFLNELDNVYRTSMDKVTQAQQSPGAYSSKVVDDLTKNAQERR